MPRAPRENHGLSRVNGKRTPLHTLWLAIRNRCNNPKTPDYRYYGGRGIRVCGRWDRFVNFIDDVGPHPGKGWTLDRIDNDGGYEPSNVRWATRQTQARNRNYCVLDEADAALIRKLYMSTHRSQEDIAKQFRITQSHVSAVVGGRAWR